MGIDRMLGLVKPTAEAVMHLAQPLQLALLLLRARKDAWSRWLDPMRLQRVLRYNS